VVITHGGTGTIQAAVSRGLRPAVFVRHGSRGEHIDDHQVDWCGALFETGLAAEMHDGDSLREYLAAGQFLQPDMEAARKFFDCSALRADLHQRIRNMVRVR
jgi:UDP-N-acetylglucosamine transferase subunit ALG13